MFGAFVLTEGSYTVVWPPNRDVLDRRDPWRTKHKVTILESAAIGPSHLLGLPSQPMGNLDQAAAHFEDALTFCRKSSYQPELAWTYCDYADTLREKNGPKGRAGSHWAHAGRFGNPLRRAGRTAPSSRDC